MGVSVYYLKDEESTQSFGAALGKSLPENGLIIYLHGELGTGKTTLSRGVIRALGHTGAVKSPTYTLVEPYEYFHFPLYHFDLYRLTHPEEVEFLGVEEYFKPPTVCIIEWPERGQGFLPAADLDISLQTQGSGRRLICRACSESGVQAATRLTALLADSGMSAGVKTIEITESCDAGSEDSGH
jgi:tRNA threonylcarbamoyladenosine biosynthesis protein TsaE